MGAMIFAATLDPALRRLRARPLTWVALLCLALAPGCGQPASPPGDGSPVGSSPAAPAAPPGQPPTLDALEGIWKADLEYNGQKGYFAMEFARGTGEGLTAAISVPVIDTWSLPLGKVTLDGMEVKVGPFTFTWDSSGPLLTGVMPQALIPVHTIPVTLRPAPNLARPAPREEILPAPRARWTFRTGGAVWAGLEIEGEALYAGSDDGNLYALEAGTGRELWRQATGGAVRARPEATGGSVFVLSDDGNLLRLDARTGERIWSARLGPAVTRTAYGEPGYRYDGFSAAPVLSGETVYAIHPSGAVAALRLADGSPLWTYDAGDTVTTTPAVDGGLLFLGCFDGRILALSAGDGSVAWERDTGAPVTTSPAVRDGSLFIGSRSYDLMSLEAATGAPRWSYYMWFSWVESAPVLGERRLYIGSSDAQRLSAIEIDTGQPAWSFDTGGSAWGRPALSDDAVYIGAVGVAGYIVHHQGSFVAVDRKSGQGIWKHESPQPEGARIWGFAASPAVGEGMVFAGGLDGVIHAFPQR